MEKKRIYLDPTLNLAKFSQIVGTNTTYLSNVVNRHYGCNFRTLLNRYRVEHAKEVLLSGEVSLVELPLHCGFISRSTFYEAFRKVTGLSPKRFEDKEAVMTGTANNNGEEN